MVESNNIIITNIIKEEHKKEVARLYFQAFLLKFNYLWLFTKSEEKAIIVLRKSIPYKEGLYAVSDNKVLGFVGLEKGTDFYTALSFEGFTEAFGLFGAVWRYLAYGIFRLFHGRAKEGTIHIDPIVVSDEARGMGIGTKLLEAVFDMAKRMKKKKVVLEVVDTNPMAKKLYERVGFRVVRIEDVAFFTRRAGFDKIFHMEKLIS